MHSLWPPSHRFRIEGFRVRHFRAYFRFHAGTLRPLDPEPFGSPCLMPPGCAARAEGRACWDGPTSPYASNPSSATEPTFPRPNAVVFWEALSGAWVQAFFVLLRVARRAPPLSLGGHSDRWFSIAGVPVRITRKSYHETTGATFRAPTIRVVRDC